MTHIRGLSATLFVCGLIVGAADAAAEERYALIVSGAAGGPEYTAQFSRWSAELADILVDRMKLERANVLVLSEAADPARSSTAANVRQALGAIRQRMGRNDLAFILLVGHGTFDGMDAKFNLVGPDIEAAEWAALVAELPGRTVFVNTSSASFPFMERLAGERRVVITATDSAAQRFDTVFPEYFIQAFRTEEADIDKNGRVSIWEAFVAATRNVRRHYIQRGQLSTERALLDDDGDGIGREAAGEGADGAAAARMYLDAPAPGAAPTDQVLLELLQKRASLEIEVDELRIRRAFLPIDEYQQEFERLMIALARIARDIRARTKS